MRPLNTPYQLCEIAPPFMVMMVSALMFRHNIYTCGSDLQCLGHKNESALADCQNSSDSYI